MDRKATIEGRWTIFEGSGIPGSKLKDIDPRKKGMPWAAWRALRLNVLFYDKGNKLLDSPIVGGLGLGSGGRAGFAELAFVAWLLVALWSLLPLITAMSSGGFGKRSTFWGGIAVKAGGATKGIKRFGAWNKEAISIAGGMATTKLCGPGDAINGIELNRFISTHIRQAHSHLSNILGFFLSYGQRECQGIAVHLITATGGRYIIHKRAVPLAFWNDLHYPRHHYYISSLGVAYIFDEVLHVSRMKAIFWITDKGLKKRRWPAIDDVGGVLDISYFGLLDAGYNVGDKITSSSKRPKGNKHNFYLSSWSTGLPSFNERLPKRLLSAVVLLGGSVGMFFGFCVLIVGVGVSSLRRSLAWSFGILLPAAFIFHLGLSWLLESYL